MILPCTIYSSKYNEIETKEKLENRNFLLYILSEVYFIYENLTYYKVKGELFLLILFCFSQVYKKIPVSCRESSLRVKFFHSLLFTIQTLRFCLIYNWFEFIKVAIGKQYLCPLTTQ